MRRLIDADKLKTDLEKAISKNEDMDCLDFLRASSVIDAQPTDYDPDKVMEQLEELGEFPCGKSGKCIHAYDDFYEKHGGCEKCVAFRAIEIVKGGGVDGN